MARPPSDNPQVQISIRIKPEWVHLADAIGEKLSRPGLEVTRADAYRIALARGFEELRSELGIFDESTLPPRTPVVGGKIVRTPVTTKTKR